MDADKRGGGGFHPARLFLFMLEYRRLTKWKIVFPRKKKKSTKSTKVHIVCERLPPPRFSPELRGSDQALFYSFFGWGRGLVGNPTASSRVTPPGAPFPRGAEPRPRAPAPPARGPCWDLGGRKGPGGPSGPGGAAPACARTKIHRPCGGAKRTGRPC